MNVKIQGGGSGAYANTGSSIGATTYLEHEDKKRLENGLEIEPFFNQNGIVEPKEASYKLDHNKGQIKAHLAKFFVLTISPSKEEIKKMGNTPQEQSANFKEYIKQGIMERYAENFDKGLKAKDIMYFAKIHHEREGKQGEQMHAHILVSRKDIENKMSLSCQTTFKEGSKGIIKSGFNRDNFFERCEKTFDKAFEYKREVEQSYRYQNTLKNGTLEQLTELKNSKGLEVQKQAQERQQERVQEQATERVKNMAQLKEKARQEEIKMGWTKEQKREEPQRQQEQKPQQEQNRDANLSPLEREMKQFILDKGGSLKDWEELAKSQGYGVQEQKPQQERQQQQAREIKKDKGIGMG